MAFLVYNRLKLQICKQAEFCSLKWHCWSCHTHGIRFDAGVDPQDWVTSIPENYCGLATALAQNSTKVKIGRQYKEVLVDENVYSCYFTF